MSNKSTRNQRRKLNLQKQHDVDLDDMKILDDFKKSTEQLITKSSADRNVNKQNTATGPQQESTKRRNKEIQEELLRLELLPKILSKNGKLEYSEKVLQQMTALKKEQKNIKNNIASSEIKRSMIDQEADMLAESRKEMEEIKQTMGEFFNDIVRKHDESDPEPVGDNAYDLTARKNRRKSLVNNNKDAEVSGAPLDDYTYPSQNKLNTGSSFQNESDGYNSDSSAYASTSMSDSDANTGDDNNDDTTESTCLLNKSDRAVSNGMRDADNNSSNSTDNLSSSTTNSASSTTGDNKNLIDNKDLIDNKSHKSEPLVTEKDIISKADNLWRTLKDYVKANPRFKKYQDKKKLEIFREKLGFGAFMEEFPIVARYMICMGQYKTSAFKRFLDKMKRTKHPPPAERSKGYMEDQWIRWQADYVQYLWEEYQKRHYNNAERQWVWQETYKRLRGEFDDFRKMHDDIEERIKEEKDVLAAKNARELMQRLTTGTQKLSESDEKELLYELQNIVYKKNFNIVLKELVQKRQPTEVMYDFTNHPLVSKGAVLLPCCGKLHLIRTFADWKCSENSVLRKPASIKRELYRITTNKEMYSRLRDLYKRQRYNDSSSNTSNNITNGNALDDQWVYDLVYSERYNVDELNQDKKETNADDQKTQKTDNSEDKKENDSHEQNNFVDNSKLTEDEESELLVIQKQYNIDYHRKLSEIYNLVSENDKHFLEFDPGDSSFTGAAYRTHDGNQKLYNSIETRKRYHENDNYPQLTEITKCIYCSANLNNYYIKDHTHYLPYLKVTGAGSANEAPRVTMIETVENDRMGEIDDKFKPKELRGMEPIPEENSIDEQNVDETQNIDETSEN